MKIMEVLKNFFKFGRKEKLIEAPKEPTKEAPTLQESLKVSDNRLEEARIQQLKEKALEEKREFQLMFALKNVCGKTQNLYSEDFVQSIKNTLQRYGYNNEIALDELDLKILNDANTRFINQPHNDILEYITNSELPSKAAATLVNGVRQKAIAQAQNFGYKKEQATQFVGSSIEDFRKVIEEEKEETLQINN